MQIQPRHGRIEEPGGTTRASDRTLAGLSTDVMRGGDVKGNCNEVDSLQKEYLPKGPTGVGVRSPIQVLRDWNRAS